MSWLVRAQATLLTACCAVGAAVAIPLAVSEGGRVDAVTIEGVASHTTAGVVQVSGRAVNHTGTTRCAEVRAVARDGESRDLLTAVAQAAGSPPARPAAPVPVPRSSAGSPTLVRLPAHGRVPVAASLRGLTVRDLREKLRASTLYVYRARRCD